MELGSLDAFPRAFDLTGGFFLSSFFGLSTFSGREGSLCLCFIFAVWFPFPLRGGNWGWGATLRLSTSQVDSWTEWAA